ncbi:MAG: AMP-binding protein, partial [Thermoproteus sp.]|nr:AMP-binding protein [Thermoproteus sp.]
MRRRIWAKNYDEGVPAEVSIRLEPLYAYLDRAVQSYGDRVAHIYFGARITYKTLGDHSDRLAKALREFGVSKGDVVALYLPNTPAFTVAYYAALKIGAVVTPMNPLYTPREVVHQAKDAGARILVTADVLYDKAAKAHEEVKFDRVVVANVADYMPPLLKPFAKMKLKPPKVPYGGSVVKYSELLRYEPDVRREPINPAEDLAALMYTGGTTGVPKGAEITHGNISANLQQLKPFYDLVKARRGLPPDAQLVLVGLLPWYHIYGQVAVMHYAIFDGHAVLVYPRPDLRALMRDVEKYKASVLHGVPTLFNMIVNHPDARRFNLRSLSFCISGATPLPVEVAKKFEELTGAPLREGYGMTETAVVTHLNPLLNGRHKPGSIGLPIPSTYAAVADLEKPILLPPGQPGELVISGPQV